MPFQEGQTNICLLMSVKEHIMTNIKETFRYGNKIAKYIEEDNDKPFWDNAREHNSSLKGHK